ncbi:MAG: DUF4157 domain-containing protein [Ignisphaera sp.]
MTKFQNLAIFLIFVVVILVSLLSTFITTFIGLPNKQKYNLNLVELSIHRLIDDVSKSLEEIRGLRFKEPIVIRIINTSWAIKMWAPEESIEIPKELLYRELIYKLSFLIPYDKTIIQLERSWVGMFLAAAAGTTLYINIDYFNPNDPSARNILAHELTHVLQFLHFQIGYNPLTLDEGLAYATLVEGDAGLTQHLYCVETKLCTPSPPTHLYLGDLYLSLNLFPYIYGESFARYLYQRGGWNLINKAYEKPPKSTLMVMNPEIYLSYLLNGTNVIVNVSIAINGIDKCALSDTLGAYYVMLILINYIGIEKATDLALNWRGDRVMLCEYENQANQSWIMLWNTTWSSPSYAINFYKNITSMLKQKSNVLEVKEDKVLAIINVSNDVRHVVEVSITKNFNVFIRSWFMKNT